MIKRLAATALLLLLAGSAHAQPAGPVCQVPKPRVPQLAWRGQAAYEALATAKDGRVVNVEVHSLNDGVDRRVQRALVQAITRALQQATCQPGTHIFTQRFDFRLGAAAPLPASAPPGDVTEMR